MHKLPIAHKNAHVRIAPAQGVEEHKVAAHQITPVHGIADLCPLRCGARQPGLGNASHGPLNQTAAVKTTFGRIAAIGIGRVDHQHGARQQGFAQIFGEIEHLGRARAASLCGGFGLLLGGG